MRAKVISDTAFKQVNACGGIWFDKETWRDVPEHEQEHALNNLYLEIERGEEKAQEPEAAPAVETPKPRGRHK